jgi:hypothetical protein
MVSYHHHLFFCLKPIVIGREVFGVLMVILVFIDFHRRCGSFVSKEHGVIFASLVHLLDTVLVTDEVGDTQMREVLNV